ncbi:hypothetical protein CPB83DRAFT_860759 [Crepidotus variabilis]|uniref:Uncharacterized protein n=1 Tax=Crepidotus variabilis TaxID=179855 RepID=A0A9P6E924_9AGAR|nr:hypothetical protein CPB83DRAFT_860759 [Crepidotus variabilis]
MRIGDLFFPWEYVLKWSLELGESNKSIISMKKRLDALDRPVNGPDIIEAYTYFESHAKETVTKRSPTWHLIQSGTHIMFIA